MGFHFAVLKLIYKEMLIEDIILDTGSGGTVFKMDKVEEIGITIEDEDTIETISGIGGSEFVYKKEVDVIKIGELGDKEFQVRKRRNGLWI